MKTEGTQVVDRIDGIDVSFGLSACISGMSKRPKGYLNQMSWNIREEDSYCIICIWVFDGGVRRLQI
jgi:hypothetical protein